MAFHAKPGSVGGPRAASPGSDGETAKKPKFDRDFIVLSEFSELVGPNPLEVYPDEKARGSFDTNQFSVRIMSSDFQSTNGKLVGDDSQVLLSEKQDCAFAYVHYFSLNDIHARGFIRQLCFSYVTSSPRKLMDNFEEIKRRFCEVTSMLKCSNLKVFKRDLTQQMADLEHTMDELEKEGLTEDKEIDQTLLYNDYDFSKEDVPERDPEQVRKSINDTGALLESVKARMSEESHQATWSEIKKQRQYYKEQRVLKDHQRGRGHLNESPVMKKPGTFISYLYHGNTHANTIESPDSGAVFTGDLSGSYSSSLTNSTSSGDLSQYEPRRVYTHIVRRFERRLRTLSELAPKAYSIMVEKVKEIYRYFHRSELVLEMEREEHNFLDPRSSLLTIGRVPMINALQDYSRHFACQQPPIVHAQRDYQISCRNTSAFPCIDGDVITTDRDDNKTSSEFDTSFLEEKSNLIKLPLYIDPLPQSTDFGPPTDSFALSENYSGTDLAPPSYLATPQADLSLTSDLGCRDNAETANAEEGVSLTVPQDEDRTSHGSRSSTAFATPLTGLTPNSSDKEDGSEIASREGTLSRSSKGEGRRSREISPEEHNLIVQGLQEMENGSSTPAKILTPSFDRLQLPTTSDHGMDKSDDLSCTSTLTGSQSSLVNENGSRTTPLQSLHQAPSRGGVTVGFLTKTSTASPRMTKHEANFNVKKHGHVPESNLSNIAINGDGKRYSQSDSWELWPGGNGVIDSASIADDTSKPPSSSSSSTSAAVGVANSHGGKDRTAGRYIKGGPSSSRGGLEEEEKHSAGSGSFNDYFSPGNHTDPPPPYDTTHTVFDARVLPTWPTDPAAATGTTSRRSFDGFPHHHDTSNGQQLPLGSTTAASTSNGVVPTMAMDAGQLRPESSLPKRLSLIQRQGSSPEQFYSPMSLPNSAFSPPSLAAAAPSSSMGVAHIPPRQNPRSPGITSVASMTSLMSTATAVSRCSYRGPSIVEIRGKGKLPLVSSVDQVEGPYKFKPGRGILPFCRDHPNISNLLYCLLHGRPLIIVGKPADKDMIRRLIRVLWLFVPGHSSKHQVIPWQDKQLDVRDLARVKLVGLSSQGPNPIGPHLKNYVSWWDCTAGKLYTPNYDGELLKPITTRNRDRKTEEIFLTYIHSVLADIAMKAYVYYHGFCANLMPQMHSRQPSASESSPQKFWKVVRKEKTRLQFLQKMNIKGCDVDIIENLVEIIREQQLAEWNVDSATPMGTLQDDYPPPVTLKLHTRLCSETYCKPKRPY